MKRMRGATLGAEGFPETLRRHSIFLCIWVHFVYFVVLKSIGSSYSLKKHTALCELCARLPPKKWNFQDCHIITGSATADFACHPILSLPSIITVPWHRTLRLPRNVTLPCDFLSFPSFCFCPVLSRVPFPS